ncbi:MAG: GTP 3',8-cyclase MoaA [Lentisphaerae bacterium]|nr:GTP 3',8-cyclase MoaA [Lentisphaerota bacterium]
MQTELENRATAPEGDHVTDRLGRPMRDLRLSVIDRCNFRCTYCMPAEEVGPNFPWLGMSEWLSFEEMLRLVRQFARLGVEKIRLTGGEPLLRAHLPELVKGLRAIPGIKDLAMTTNGILLSLYAADLKEAGLDRVTVSLDALDETVFRTMNGGFDAPAKVLEGIEAAQAAGFKDIKINTVVRRDINMGELVPILTKFRGSDVVVRFIEYMDVGNVNHWESDQVVSSAELIDLISNQWEIEPVAKNYSGEVADRYRYADGSGEIGFVSSISQPFCRPCNRSRLSVDGKLFTCLFATEGTDLREPVRSGESDEELHDRIAAIWTQRTDQYSQLRWGGKKKKDGDKKIEMFYIGG